MINTKMSFDRILNKNAVEIIKALEENGFEAYAVGGCVRDYLMGIEQNDTDFATNATPLQIKSVFAGLKTVDIGEKYGTITVFLEGERFEITTYRTDNLYKDSRHPESVSFSDSIYDDLKRRDFTINAIAYNMQNGIVDAFGGTDDIKNGIIRCVGNPKERFSEDGLRIMRALRFSACLGFKLEENTRNAAFECAYMLKGISAQRLRDELIKLICGKNAVKVLVEYAQILAVFIPEIKPCIGFCQHSIYHRYDVWEHIAHAVLAAPVYSEAKLAALFHDIAKPACFTMDSDGTGHFKGHAALCAETAQSIMERLHFSARQIWLVKTVIACHSDTGYTEKSVRRRISKLGYDGFNLLLDLQCADNSAKHDFCRQRLDFFEKWRSYASELEYRNACMSLRDLAVNGNDIKSLGFCGRDIGIVLKTLLELVIDNMLENDYDVLICKAEQMKKA